MAWCKVSSLMAAVSRTLAACHFPMSRSQILTATAGKNVEGWEVDYFLSQALKKKSYPNLRTVMAEVDDWLNLQG